jgi:uncharacterized tellurite resistance protein B-like protein
MGASEFFRGTQDPKFQIEIEDPAALSVPVKRAICAILLEVASVDGEFAEKELLALVKLLEQHLHIPNAELLTLLEEADDALRNAHDIGQFAKVLADVLTDGQKFLLMMMIWKVIHTDGRTEINEERLAKNLKNALNLRDDLYDHAHAEARAEFLK